MNTRARVTPAEQWRNEFLHERKRRTAQHYRDQAELARLRAVLESAQELRLPLLKQYGAVPECVLDFCNRARAVLS